MKRTAKYLMTVICVFSIILCSISSVFAEEASVDEHVLPPSTEPAFTDEPISAEISQPQAPYASLRMIKLRVMLGKTYRNDKDESSKDVPYVDVPFRATWNIGFTPSYTYINNLPIDKCTLDKGKPCDNAICGSNCTNSTNTYIHHKNAAKNLLAIINGISSAGYDIMLTLVSSPMCRVRSNGTHDDNFGVLGVAEIGGTYALANGASTRTQTRRIRTMQHEISHLFGCKDGECAVGEKCIFNGGFYEDSIISTANIWCSNCKKSFDASLH